MENGTMPALEIGKHRLHCGDSTNVDDVNVNDGKARAVFATDPPYLVDYDGTNHLNGPIRKISNAAKTRIGPDKYTDVDSPKLVRRIRRIHPGCVEVAITQMPCTAGMLAGTQSPLDWPYGRTTELRPSADHLVR